MNQPRPRNLDLTLLDSPTSTNITLEEERSQHEKINILNNRYYSFLFLVIVIESILLLNVFIMVYRGYFSSTQKDYEFSFRWAKILGWTILVSLFIFAIGQTIYMHRQIAKLHSPFVQQKQQKQQEQQEQQEQQGQQGQQKQQGQQGKVLNKIFKKELTQSVKQYYELIQYFLLIFIVLCAWNNKYFQYMVDNTRTFLKEIGFYMATFSVWACFIYFMRKPYTERSWSSFFSNMVYILLSAFIVMVLLEIGGFNSNFKLSSNFSDLLNPLSTYYQTSIPSSDLLLERKHTIEILFFILYFPIFGFILLFYIFLSTSFMNAELESLYDTYQDSILLHQFFGKKYTEKSQNKNFIMVLLLLFIEAIVFGFINSFSYRYVVINHDKFYNSIHPSSSVTTTSLTPNSSSWFSKSSLVSIIVLIGFHFLLQFIGFYNRISTSQEDKSILSSFYHNYLKTLLQNNPTKFKRTNSKRRLLPPTDSNNIIT